MIESAVLERQDERIRLSKLNPLREPTARSQDACRFDEVEGEVYCRHLATAFGCEVARCAAETATEIEHVHAALYARAFLMLSSSHDTPAVQLVKRPQIATAGPLGINSSGSERVVNPLYADRRSSAEPPPRRRSCLPPISSSIAAATRPSTMPRGRTRPYLCPTHRNRTTLQLPGPFLTHPDGS